MTIHVICRNAEGEPDICTVQLEVSALQLRSGEHYGLAIAEAEKRGYDTTHRICVDEMDHIYRRIKS